MRRAGPFQHAVPRQWSLAKRHTRRGLQDTPSTAKSKLCDDHTRE